ncbi:MAG: ketopantoate reductase family protein [Raoultibacter sp.]|jgi:2-dehydropantoate 2-reductase
MKIAVLGAGSLGSVIGGALSGAGHEVHLIGRKAHMDAIEASGLILVDANGDERIVHPLVHTNSDGIGPVDLLIVLVKTYSTAEALNDGASLIADHTTVLPLQNGLGNEELISDIVGAEHVIGGRTYIGGRLINPGKVSAGISQKNTYIGEMDGTITNRVKEIEQAFNEAGMHCEATDKIVALIWDKLMVNVATGALSGITGLPYGFLYQDERIKQTAIAAVQEAMDVAQAEGVSLSYKDASEPWVLAAEGLPFDFKASILQSLEKKRLTEVDTINGAVVERGKKQGIPCPVNTTLVACIHGIETYNKEYS